MNMPSITDWIQAIAAAIAVPGAIISFILLFSKDKNKQEQINRLAGIAEKLEAQNEIMKEANKLSGEQVDILRTSLILNVKDENESKQDNKSIDKLAEIEEKKLKLSVKPILKIQSTESNPGRITLHLINLGERAIIDEISVVEGDLVIQPPNIKVIDKEDIYSIMGFSANNANANFMNYRIKILYKDSLTTKYKVEITKEARHTNMSEPVEEKE